MKLLSEPLMGLGLLKYIRNGWDRFAYFTCIEVRNGSNVFFRKDHWFGNGSHRSTYPELFRFAAIGNACVRLCGVG